MIRSLAIRFGESAYRSALVDAAAELGLDVIEPDGDIDGADCAVLMYVDNEDRWNELADHAATKPAVALLPEVNIVLYCRALAIGAGAVHVDNSPATIIDVIIAATLGEARVPLAVTQALALHSPPTREDVRAFGLSRIERTLAAAVCEDLSATEIADRLGYSERTIRRKLQGLYLKLGVSSRAEAIQSLAQ